MIAGSRLIAAWAAVSSTVYAAPSNGRSACTDVHVRVDTPSDAVSSRALLERVVVELSTRTPEACDSRSEARVVIEWLSTATARIRVRLTTPERQIEQSRDLDLTPVAADGLPMAVAIAVDDLLDEVRARAASAPPALREPADETYSESEGKQRAPAGPEPSPWQLGSRLSAQWFASGVTLFGPDAVLRWTANALATASLRVGLRAVVDGATTARQLSMPSAGIGFGVHSRSDSLIGAEVEVRLDALGEATRGGHFRGALAPGFSVVGEARLDGGIRIVVDSGFQAAWPALRLAGPGRATLDDVGLNVGLSLLVDL